MIALFAGAAASAVAALISVRLASQSLLAVLAASEHTLGRGFRQAEGGVFRAAGGGVSRTGGAAKRSETSPDCRRFATG